MQFGRTLQSWWALDPSVTYLNHGTVGATPRRVLAAQQTIRDEIERQPARFQLRELADVDGSGPTQPRMRVAAAAVAEFVGAEADDVVFVDNITAAANAVLRSYPFEAGDVIAVTSLGYGGVTNVASFVARTVGATLHTISMPRPGAAPEAFVEAIANGLPPSCRMLVVDHITATTALVLPIHEIVAAARRRGVLVFVDGAHAPGNIPLDIPSIGADFYGANLHKWAWAPRSCGLLWVRRELHSMVHPPVISWGLDHGLAAEFDLLGTRDPTPFLTAPFAIDMMREIGLDAIHSYNHDLAWWTGHYLADRWVTPFMAPQSMVGAMVNVALPPMRSDASDIRAALERLGFEVPCYADGDRLTTRISAQIYNDRSDIERLCDAVLRLAQ